MQQLVRDFRNRGWTTLPFNDIGLVDRVVGGLEELIAAPQEELQRWSIDRTLFPQEGLVVNNARAGCGSLTFQFSPAILEGLKKAGVDVEGRAEWLWACERLWMRAFAVCLYAARTLDRGMPMRGFAEGLDRTGSVLQILRVDPEHTGPVRRHIDPNAVTVHIAESVPVLHFDSEAPDQEPNTARVLAGAQMMHRTWAPEARPDDPSTWGDETIPACPHWANMPEERSTPWWAAVFFVRGREELSDEELLAIRRHCLKRT